MTEQRTTITLWAAAALFAAWLLIFNGGNTRTEFTSSFTDAYHNTPTEQPADAPPDQHPEVAQ